MINQSIIDVHVDDLKPYEHEVTPDSWLEDRESQETTKINENSANMKLTSHLNWDVDHGTLIILPDAESLSHESMMIFV